VPLRGEIVIPAEGEIFMKSFVAVIAVAVLGVTGLCHADDQRNFEALSVEPVGADQPSAVTPQSEDVGAPSRALKAVLYEVSREHTIQKRFAGSVVWHADRVVSTDEPLPKIVIRADVEIPDLHVTVKLFVAHNDDRSFRASHTVEIVVTLPPDFVHGGVINIPRILMKQGETTPGIPLNSVSVMITPRLFQIGLSNIGTDRQRNIELIKELSWIDLPIVYSDGSWAILGIERGDLDERALAVLESPAVEPLPRRVPTNYLPELKPWPVVAPGPSLSLLFPTRPRLNIKLPPRPSWVWPPLEWWAVAPGLPSGSWTWQPGWQPVLRETIRLASTTMAASMPGARLPSWVQDTSRSVMPESVPPWPRARAPDFHIPTGRSRFAGERNLEPPAQFVRWSDRLETVLAGEREVTRRCLAVGSKLPPLGRVIRGCAHGTAGRCFIIRIDDSAVARHELAHCNGWKHP
jgi:hypothetical protein